MEENEIDIVALIKSMWAGRKVILISTAVFLALGILSALTMKRTYTVSSVMVPQLGQSRSNAALARLAGLSAFELSGGAPQDLSPLVYPQIVGSVTFRRELMYTPLHYEKVDTAICMFDYVRDYGKATTLDKVRKYTIGLPGTLVGAVKGLVKKDAPEQDFRLLAAGEAAGEAADGEETVRPIVLTKEEQRMIGVVGNCVNLTVERKEGYLTLIVTGSEPLQTAELAVNAQRILQEHITSFRTEKAQSQLEYMQARYDETKAEAEAYQIALATVTDRSQNMTTTRARIERDRLQSKYTVANAIYTELAKQLEQAKMQVKQDTPMLTIIQPITVPSSPSNSRGRTIMIWTFFGVVLGCGIVFGKNYLPKWKEMFTKTDTD